MEIKTRWVWIVLWLLLLVLTRLPALLTTDYLNIDESTLSLGGKLITQGGMVHRDLWESRPPLTHLLYALMRFISGSGGIFPVRLLMLAFVAATSLLVKSSVKLLTGKSGWLAAYLFLICSAWGFFRDLAAANIELLAALPLTLGLFLILKNARDGKPAYFLLASLSLGIAVLFKAIMAVNLVVIITCLSFLPSIGKRFSWICGTIIAFLLPIILLVLIYTLAGDTGDLWVQNIVFNLQFVSATPWNLRILFAAQTSFWLLLSIIPILSLILFSPRLKSPVIPSGHWIVGGFLLINWLGGVSGGKPFPHYLIPVYAPAAILGGMAVSKLMGKKLRGFIRLSVAAAILMQSWLTAATLAYFISPILFTTVSPANFPLRRFFTETYPSKPDAADAYVRDHTNAADPVLVWGFEPYRYLNLDRPLASRYVLTVYVTGQVPGLPEQLNRPEISAPRSMPGSWQELLGELDFHEPKYIMENALLGCYGTKSEDWVQMRNYLEKHYVLEKEMDGIRIFSRIK